MVTVVTCSTDTPSTKVPDFFATRKPHAMVIFPPLTHLDFPILGGHEHQPLSSGHVNSAILKRSRRLNHQVSFFLRKENQQTLNIPIFPWIRHMKKKQQNITRFLCFEARHFQIPKVQIFRWGHNAWCSPGFWFGSLRGFRWFVFSMAATWHGHGEKNTTPGPCKTKLTNIGLNDPNGNFLVFQPSIFRCLLAVSFREGRTPLVSWPENGHSMKWGPKCHFLGVKCHSIL